MIQELTDRGPSRTYPVYYLEDAMNNLGDCFDYAVNDYGAEGSEVAELFCLERRSPRVRMRQRMGSVGKIGR